MDFEVNLRERILKPVNEVFDAFADHRQMSRYFIRGASGPIRPGTVEWEFGDVGVKVSIDVEVEEKSENRARIERPGPAHSHHHRFHARWAGRHRGYRYRIEISPDGKAFNSPWDRMPGGPTPCAA